VERAGGAAPASVQNARNAQLDRVKEVLDSAREEFLPRDGVIGVGYGFKEKGGQILEDDPAIIVYVQQKKDKKDLNPKDVISRPHWRSPHRCRSVRTAQCSPSPAKRRHVAGPGKDSRHHPHKDGLR